MPRLLVPFSLIAVFLCAAVRSQTSFTCQDFHGTFCNAVENFCNGSTGSCHSCVATSRNAACDGDEGPCNIKYVATGCGNAQSASCDPQGQCRGWVTMSSSCDILECD